MQELTQEEKIIQAIGGDWDPDTTEKTWMVEGPNGPEPMTFKWAQRGARLSLASGTMAIKDAREA